MKFNFGSHAEEYGFDSGYANDDLFLVPKLQLFSFPSSSLGTGFLEAPLRTASPRRQTELGKHCVTKPELGNEW